MTGETPEVRSDKRKPRERKREKKREKKEKVKRRNKRNYYHMKKRTHIPEMDATAKFKMS